jgi:hypothetical protein
MTQQARQQTQTEQTERPPAHAPSAEPRPQSSSTRRALDDATNEIAARGPARPARPARRNDDDDDDDGGWFGSITRSVSNVARRATNTVSSVAQRATNTVSDVAERVTNTASDVGERVTNTASDVAERATRAVLGDERGTAHDLPAAGERDESGRVARIELEGDGGGLLGLVSRGVRGAGDLASDVVRAAAPIADATILRGSGFNATELAEEVEDLADAAGDHFDEDLRDTIEVATGTPPARLPQADREFRLPDPEQQADIRERTRTLFNGVDGAGTDPALIREALHGANPEMIRAMRAEYARTHQGRDMLRDIDRDVSGSLENEIEGLLTGDPVEQAIATIDGSTHGISSDNHAMMDAIRDCPADQRDEVIAAFEERGGETLEQRLGRETGPADGRVAMALLENREDDAIAYRLDDELNNGTLDLIGRAVGIEDLGSPNPDEIYRIMENIPESRRQGVIDSFDGMDHRDGQSESLETALDREMEEGPERDRAQALREGDRALADAHAMRMAAEEPWYESQAAIGAVLLATPLAPIGAVVLLHAAANEACNGGTDLNSTDTEGLIGVVERRPNESESAYRSRMEATEDAFNREYGNGDEDAFDDMLSEELGEGSRDHVRATNTIHNGGVMDWRVRLDYATERRLWSTDEDEAIAALEQARAEGDIERMSDDERQQLTDQVNSEMDGRPALQALEALEGDPETPQGWIERWERRHELDRDTLIGSDITDLHSTSGADYDRHMEELRGLVDGNGNIRPGQEARFEELRATLEGDQGSYRTRQDEASEVAVQVAATTAAVTVMAVGAVLTAGTSTALTPAVIAGLSALAGGTAGMGTRGAMQGDAYEREDILQDGVRTAISTIAAGGTQALQTAIPVNTLLGRAALAVPGAQLEMASDLAMSEDEIEWNDVGERALQAGGQVVGTAVGETVEDAIGGGPNLGRRMLAAGTGGAAESALGTSAELDTYDDGALAALGQIAGSGLEGAATSSLLAATEVHHEASERRAGRSQLDAAMHQAALDGVGDNPVVQLRRGADEPHVVPGEPAHVERSTTHADTHPDTADSLINEIVGTNRGEMERDGSTHLDNDDVDEAEMDAIVDEVLEPERRARREEAERVAAEEAEMDAIVDDVLEPERRARREEAERVAAEEAELDAIVEEVLERDRREEAELDAIVEEVAPSNVREESPRSSHEETELDTIVDESAAAEAARDTRSELIRDITGEPGVVTDPDAIVALVDRPRDDPDAEAAVDDIVNDAPPDVVVDAIDADPSISSTLVDDHPAAVASAIDADPSVASTMTDADPTIEYAMSNPDKLAKLRSMYPDLCDLPDDTIVYRYTGDEEGGLGHAGETFWQTQPNEHYADKYLRQTTVGELRGGGEVRYDPHEMHQGDDLGASLIALHNEGQLPPGTNRSVVLGYTTSGAPVYRPGYGNPPEGRWTDFDGNVHFPSEEPDFWPSQALPPDVAPDDDE